MSAPEGRMANVREKIRRVGERVRPGRDFAERRAVVERGRSATWQVTIALIVATIGAAALGYLAVQLYFLPATLREARLNRVPSLTGMELDDAAAKAEAAGYVVSVAGRDYSDDVDRGEIIFQNPPPDMYLPRGDTLRVLLSLGEAEPAVPDVSGLEIDLARRVLALSGVGIAGVTREASDVHPQGTVVRTDPPAGTPIEEVDRGDDGGIAIVLSRGGSRLTMPDVADLTLAQARDTLEVYSLTVGEVTGLPEGEEEATEGLRVVVTDQDPPAGRLVSAGTAINLTLGQARGRRETPAQPPREEFTPPADESPADHTPADEAPGEEPEQPEQPAEADEVPAEEVPVPRPAPPDTSR